ncbi:unnamed protein product [Parnassius apollo]|uniref:(apollo) hypothetical protein n=1 Tax=Parnassius apollo TaxID=110799 RepID=A0A8S3X646_PARAO|nr:unnamed protein product [Parnassius apollo]
MNELKFTLRRVSRQITRLFIVPDSKRQKLFPYVVPSQNIPKRSSDKEVPLAQKIKSITRENRADIRHRKIVESNKELGLAIENEETKFEDGFEDNNITDNNSHRHVMTSSTQVNLVDYRNYRPRENWSIADILCDKEPLEKCTQINFLPMWEEDRSALKQLTLSDLLSSDMYLFTFTGIHLIELLETLVTCVSELALDAPTNKKMLSVRDRVILTMVKIKQNMLFRAIGVLFGINWQTCSNYFNNMCPMLSRVLKVVIPWPDIEMIPKFNIGITPSGLITEISASYGGRASDKHIVNESGILNKCEFNDGVMVDKGYRIESECNERLLQLVRSPFLSQKKQMTKEDAIRTAEIARARVHVERVIQRLRQYKLLCGPLPWSLAPYFVRILIIVGGLTNLGPPIIHIDKFM